MNNRQLKKRHLKNIIISLLVLFTWVIPDIKKYLTTDKNILVEM